MVNLCHLQVLVPGLLGPLAAVGLYCFGIPDFMPIMGTTSDWLPISKRCTKHAPESFLNLQIVGLTR